LQTSRFNSKQWWFEIQAEVLERDENEPRIAVHENSKLPDQLSSLLFVDDKNRTEYDKLALVVVAAIFLATLSTLLLFLFPIKVVCQSWPGSTIECDSFQSFPRIERSANSSSSDSNENIGGFT
jgi:hypothetical protein